MKYDILRAQCVNMAGNSNAALDQEGKLKTFDLASFDAVPVPVKK